MLNKKALEAGQTQQNVLTNQLIKEKLNSQGSSQSSLAIKKSDAEKSKSKSNYVSKHQNHQSKVNSLRNTQVQRQSVNGGASSRSETNSAPKGGVIKTIVLPHEDLNRLGVEGQHLLQVLRAQEALFNDTVAGYQKDRSVRTQEFDMK